MNETVIPPNGINSDEGTEWVKESSCPIRSVDVFCYSDAKPLNIICTVILKPGEKRNWLVS